MIQGNEGLTVIGPDSYTPDNWYVEAVRLFGANADVRVLQSPSGNGFERIHFRDRVFFLGAAHHLPGLFDTEEKITFWTELPAKKYFFQYEPTIDSYWPDNERKERVVHRLNAAVYAVQDVADYERYEHVFGVRSIWLPDLISRQRVERGAGYRPLRRRPIDMLFIGKMQGEWYEERRGILHAVVNTAKKMRLKIKMIDTSKRRKSDTRIESYYARSKMVINPIGIGNFFNIRFFESLAAGAVCLQQADRNGVSIRPYLERYRDYNTTYFTADNVAEKIESVFDDLAHHEEKAAHTSALLLEKDTGESRFGELGII